ncbi:hypothetical protein T440DRAFT_322795 [Plenodomus tracheiphilus IPT5]|uniref:Transcription factor domain-containing protein n=1 Tax=Plenodomus tracheiphilus IPT5 TaxID=1408161 RepID=A0A6A7BD01_9PLEO|nr:hypothetical protein T440DRAFT_322795 [Plenodomus tracheiphilus IPT5]
MKTMMDALSVASTDGTRKRPCKSIRRACWECKKRKIQASGDQPDASSVASSSGVGPGRADQDSNSGACARHISERLCKLEELFEKFVCRKNPVASTALGAPRSPPLTASEQSEKDIRFGMPAFSSDTQSLSSIGEGILGAQTWSSAPSIRTLVDKQGAGRPSSHGETAHKSLVALLPSQHDADIIFESSNGWMILGSIYRASPEIYVDRDRQSYALNMQAISQERTIIVARTLLHLAICINSLPPEFNASRLSSMWNLDATMQNYVATVTSLMTCSDEVMMTLHGLETLLLLGLYHMNSASLRQAWLIIRRGLSLAHLMGFQHIIAQEDLDPPIPAVSNAKTIWRNLVDLDRYLGLHLRLPFGAEDYPLPEDADAHLIHRSRVNALSKQVAELDREISPQAYATALALDEKLEMAMREMPREFWEVPNIPPTARSPESHAALERLMVQMFHFEMKIFIHLPYLLRAPQESRYEYSKITALQASRNVLMRWFALRNANITQACCRLGEIGVFIAAITLTLDIVIELGTKEKSEVQKTKGTDFAMLCRLITEMEKLAKASPREKIAARSAVVLKKMLSSLDPSKQPASKARLTIPFFGSVDFVFKQLPIKPVFNADRDAGKMLEATATGKRLPIFSFVHNSLWPLPAGKEEFGFDWDIVLYDGLEDRDTDGNWVF